VSEIKWKHKGMNADWLDGVHSRKQQLQLYYIDLLQVGLKKE
jgi:hypothetical protein